MWVSSPSPCPAGEPALLTESQHHVRHRHGQLVRASVRHCTIVNAIVLIVVLVVGSTIFDVNVTTASSQQNISIVLLLLVLLLLLVFVGVNEVVAAHITAPHLRITVPPARPLRHHTTITIINMIIIVIVIIVTVNVTTDPHLPTRQPWP